MTKECVLHETFFYNPNKSDQNKLFVTERKLLVSFKMVQKSVKQILIGSRFVQYQAIRFTWQKRYQLF